MKNDLGLALIYDFNFHQVDCNSLWWILLSFLNRLYLYATKFQWNSKSPILLRLAPLNIFRAKYFWSAIITKHWMIPNKTLASEMQIDSEKHLSVIHLVIQMPIQIGKAAISTNLFHQQELRLHKCLQKHLLELVTQGPKGGSKVVIKCECIFQKSN